MWGSLQAKWHSLIFRLLFYFVLAMLAIAIIVAVSFAQRFKPHFENEIVPNLAQYIEYLIEDIGTPPDLAVAQNLAEQLPIEIRIRGKTLDWSSSPAARPFDSYVFKPAPRPYEGVYIGEHRRDEVLLVERGDYRYLFSMDNGFRDGSERRQGFLLLLLGAVLFLLYLAIRRMFRPIQAISRQVEKIGSGDLEQRIEASGKGELALLATGINEMSAQIKSMLESKSGLLLAISHELRSPITRMRVNLELLEPSETRQKLVSDLREMESLVAAILESERLNNRHAPLSLARCELLELVTEVVQSHPCRERIKTSLSPVELEVDALRIKLLLKNLVDNACRYSDAETGWIEIALRASATGVWISVQDHGIGIDADDIPHLTEAFYRPDSARQRETGGYGLGLYLCKLIVDAHGGKLTFDSEPGRGTLATVELPPDNS